MTINQQFSLNNVTFTNLYAWDQFWFNSALQIYIQAMNYTKITALQQAPLWQRHITQGNATIIGAFNEDQLIGITFGFPGDPTDRWCNELQKALKHRGQSYEEIQALITNYFELSELHVLPAYQGMGIGSQLLMSLLENQNYSHVLLSTPEVANEANGAWKLYRKFGFHDVIRGYFFPGDFRSFAILKKDLPL